MMAVTTTAIHWAESGRLALGMGGLGLGVASRFSRHGPPSLSTRRTCPDVAPTSSPPCALSACLQARA